MNPGPKKTISRRSNRVVAAALGVGVALLVTWWLTSPPDNLRARLERIHGIHLPPSATNIQSHGDAWHGFLDRGEATLFEMSSSDLAGFVSGLKITSRNFPTRTTSADPTLNGWNVWPTTAKSFVPGNPQYGGFSRTWPGEAVPVEMLSCASPTGDWLHVEYWKLPGEAMLVKMFTDWN